MEEIEKNGIKETKMEVEVTKKGYPALWEEGGGHKNTGYAQIITASLGSRKTPLFINRHGELANGQHALFIVEKKDYIIKVYNDNINVYQIKDFNIEEKYVVMDRMYEFSQGEWDEEPPEFLMDAINAAVEKSKCYHCRSAHYASA